MLFGSSWIFRGGDLTHSFPLAISLLDSNNARTVPIRLLDFDCPLGRLQKVLHRVLLVHV